MNIRRSITITGNFQHDEFKNLLSDKVNRFNMEQKDPSHPNLTGIIDDPREHIITVLIEGDKEDIEVITSLCKRGPVISHIEKVDCSDSSYQGQWKGFRRKGLAPQKDDRPTSSYRNKRRR